MGSVLNVGKRISADGNLVVEIEMADPKGWTHLEEG